MNLHIMFLLVRALNKQILDSNEKLVADQIIDRQRIGPAHQNHRINEKEILAISNILQPVPGNSDWTNINNNNLDIRNRLKNDKVVGRLSTESVDFAVVVKKYPFIDLCVDMIVDVITVSTYNCPRDYEPFTSTMWDGTKEGCLCQTQINQYDYVHVLPGECSMRLIGAGCTRVDPQKSMPFVFWKTEKLICVKRIQGLNFYTNLTQQLPKNELKTCSPNTPFQTLSLAKHSCPVTSLSNSTQTYPFLLPQISFSFTNQSSYPLIDIKISQYSFCQEYNRANISPNRFKNYDLQTVEIQNCVDDRDPRVKIVDQITQRALFQSNQRIHDIVMNVLPIYPRPTDKYRYFMGTVEYPPWSIDCRKSDTYNLTVVKKNIQFNQPIQKSQLCLGLTIAFISIWGIVYSIISIIRHIMDINYKKKHGILFYPLQTILRIDPNFHTKPNTFLEFVIFIFLISFLLGMLIQLGIQYQYINGLEQWLRMSYLCMVGANGEIGGYFYDWITEGYVNRLQSNIRSYLICILVGVVGAALDFVFMVWRLNRGDLAEVKIKDIFGNDEEERNSDDNINIEQQKQKQNPDNIKDKEVEGILDQNNQVLDRQKTGDVDIFGMGGSKEKNQQFQFDQQFDTKKNKSKAGFRSSGLRNTGMRNSPIKNSLANANKNSAANANLKNKGLGKSGAVSEINNFTQESLVNDKQDISDELQFQEIKMEKKDSFENLGSSISGSMHRSRKLPQNKKNKKLLQFDD